MFGAGPSQWKRIPGEVGDSLGVISDAYTKERGCGSWIVPPCHRKDLGTVSDQRGALGGPALVETRARTDETCLAMGRFHAVNAARVDPMDNCSIRPGDSGTNLSIREACRALGFLPTEKYPPVLRSANVSQEHCSSYREPWCGGCLDR